MYSPLRCPLPSRGRDHKEGVLCISLSLMGRTGKKKEVFRGFTIVLQKGNGESERPFDWQLTPSEPCGRN